MAGLDPPARPKPLRRGEGPAIHVFVPHEESKTWITGHRRAKATPFFERLRPVMTAPYVEAAWIASLALAMTNNKS
jgi:hypothetical protein